MVLSELGCLKNHKMWGLISTFSIIWKSFRLRPYSQTKICKIAWDAHSALFSLVQYVEIKLHSTLPVIIQNFKLYGAMYVLQVSHCCVNTRCLHQLCRCKDTIQITRIQQEDTRLHKHSLHLMNFSFLWQLPVLSAYYNLNMNSKMNRGWNKNWLLGSLFYLQPIRLL